MLFDPLDAILGRRSHVRLLRTLAPLDRPVSGREAARLAGLSHRVITALDDLAALGIVHGREAAGQHLYTFNREHALAAVIAGLFEAERRRTSELFKRVAGVIEGSGPAVSAAFFGSAARGEAGPGSDLDVLVLVPDRAARDDIHSGLVDAAPALETEFGVRLSPVVVTVDRFRQQHAEGDPFVGEVRRDGRRICGYPIEELIGG